MSEIQNFYFKDFYSEKINHLKLQDALDMHYKLNPQFTPWFDYEKGILQDTMKAHDICHIIFGCSTTLPGEFRVELWSALGTNLGTVGYAKIASNKKVLNEPLMIVKKIGFFKVIGVMLFHFFDIFKIMGLSRKMNKKWECFEEEKYLQTTVGEIRKEFGVTLMNFV